MEFEVQTETQHNFVGSEQNTVKLGEEGLESEVAKEILYLDEVLEANGCDSRTEMNSNGTSSPDVKIHGTGPSVHTCDTSPSQSHEAVLEAKKQTTFIDDNFNTKPNGHAAMVGNCTRSPDSPRTAAKKEARFELRPFHEEKKPSKLFETPTEKEIRVKKIRPSEEVAELEKERLELIRGQAVKKNPGIAAKWWNPPQEKTLEEELEPEQLESLRRYEERKQRKPEINRMPQTTHQQTIVFTQGEIGNKEDVVVEEIDFSSARKQFMQMEQSKQSSIPKRNVAPQLYSAKPFFRTPEVTHVERPLGSVTLANQEGIGFIEGYEITKVKAENVYSCPGECVLPTKESLPRAELKDDDFTCARAVMTIVKDEDADLCQQSLNCSYHTEEIDSGLDDLSLRSQDTTVLETLSNDFSMDNISDSGASNETMSAYLENSLGEYSFPSTPLATTPINGKHESGIKSPEDQSLSYQSDGFTEEELEYHAGILVQNAIQQAIAQQNDKWELLQSTQHSSPIPERNVESFQAQHHSLAERSTVSPTPKVPSTPGVKKTTPPQITIVQAAPVVPVNTHKLPSPSPPPIEKSEFSYFSKYSEAAELRSTAAVTRGQESEVTSGPFKLRSRKQRTLSMIEEEIRAAQEREEELKRQRQVQSLHPTRAQKHASTQPSKLVLTGKTVPGKIEKVRPLPPASPCSSDGALPSPLSDPGSDDSAGSMRPKNFMQTLMDDYETHKVKRREKAEDNSFVRSVTTEVLEATRVTRRKSNMALRWEAGIYANQENLEGEEEEEEEEE
ncbi:hypothetical protein DNTS_008752 [Danionella cerebrum]|uniref:Uncharacterized protein n=1 Tax=Danionella cerebrum TaxID=2873325 RepID=A0A553Q2U9_9TELE|nr:hypothetical protein DNTS_008752 [Danionella translucida]